jgi:hypothetical protein
VVTQLKVALDARERRLVAQLRAARDLLAAPFHRDAWL